MMVGSIVGWLVRLSSAWTAATATLWALSSQLFTQLTTICIFLTLFFSLSYYLGWVQRILWFIAEENLSEALQTTVTIGSLDVSLRHGTVSATNVIVHTPKQEEWRWESPLIARVGRISAHLNLWGFVAELIPQLYREFILRKTDQLVPVDIYSVDVADCQVFVERQHNVFNFHLLDPTMIIPDPSTIVKQPPTTIPSSVVGTASVGGTHSVGTATPADGESSTRESASSSATTGEGERSNGNKMKTTSGTTDEVPTKKSNSGSTSTTDDASSTVTTCASSSTTNYQQGSTDHQHHHQDDQHNEEAREILQQMFSAVQTSLKKHHGWREAWRVPKEQLTSKLREWQRAPQKMQEATRMLQQAVSQTQTNWQKATQMPSSSNEGPPPPPFVLRIGRIQLREARVFTRDYLRSSATNTTNKKSTQQQQQTSSSSSSSSPPTSSLPLQQSFGVWNKPMVLTRTLVRAAELSPGLSLMDPDTGLPAIYQPIDKLIEVMARKILAELAKSQSGRLFQNAVGEVLGIIVQE